MSPSALVWLPGLVSVTTGAMVHWKVWLAPTVKLSPSVALTVTVYAPPRESPSSTVPEITPVDASMLNPAGRLLA